MTKSLNVICRSRSQNDTTVYEFLLGRKPKPDNPLMTGLYGYSEKVLNARTDKNKNYKVIKL